MTRDLVNGMHRPRRRRLATTTIVGAVTALVLAANAAAASAHPVSFANSYPALDLNASPNTASTVLDLNSIKLHATALDPNVTGMESAVGAKIFSSTAKYTATKKRMIVARVRARVNYSVFCDSGFGSAGGNLVVNVLVDDITAGRTVAVKQMNIHSYRCHTAFTSGSLELAKGIGTGNFEFLGESAGKQSAAIDGWFTAGVKFKAIPGHQYKIAIGYAMNAWNRGTGRATTDFSSTNMSGALSY